MNRVNPYALLFLMLAMSAMPACQTAPVATTQPTGPLDAATTQPDQTSDAEALPGLPPRAVAPRRGAALTQAKMSLPKILAALPQPRYLAPSTQPSSQPAAAEPSLAAQHAYLRGKRAYLERRAFDAIRELQAAEQIEPNSPAILRLLGTIYIASGSNKARGAAYLERVVQLEPYDVESLFFLGSTAMEQGKPGMPAATATFAHALSLKGDKRAADADPSIWPLLNVFLGNALEAQGYDEAAMQQFMAFVSSEPNFSRSSALGRILYNFARQGPMFMQSIGDQKMRLGDPAGALEVYNTALGEDPLSLRTQPLVSRIVYAQCRLGQTDAAVTTVSEYLRRNKAEPTAGQYLTFLATRVNRPRLVKAMQGVYDETGRPTTLALAIADIMPQAEAVDFLRKHLETRPRDSATFDRLVKIFTDPKAGPDGLRKAVAVVDRAMADASPTQARSLAMTLVAGRDDQGPLLAAIDAMPETDRTKPNVLVIRGLSLMQARRLDEARAMFEQAVAAKPEQVAARVELVRLLLARNDVKAAQVALQPISDRTDTTIVPLRVEVLLRSGQLEAAVKLLDQLIAAEPMNYALPLQKARLQSMTGDVVGCERTLEETLDRFPQNEDVFIALYELYDSAQGEQLPDAVQSWQRLFKRVLGVMPNSRIAKLMRADWAGANSQFEQQEKLLEPLLLENPNDFLALAKLVESYDHSGKQPQALSLIEGRIAKSPREKNLYIILRAHYQREANKAKVLETTEKMLLLDPPSPDRSRELALIGLMLERPADAVKLAREGLQMSELKDPQPLLAVLRRATNRTNEPDVALEEINRAIERFPDQWADLQLELALFHDHANRKGESEKIMLQVLEKNPNHHQTLNSLGYAWADQGRNLDRARAMIQTAVDAEPNSAAYLDSLGWVYYKMGDFKTAVQWLQRAVAARGGNHPVLLSHLGDALYRNGEPERAQQTWQAALMRMVDLDELEMDDPELNGLAKRLRERMDALTAQKPPAVAPLGKDVKVANTPPKANAAPAPSPRDVPKE